MSSFGSDLIRSKLQQRQLYDTTVRNDIKAGVSNTPDQGQKQERTIADEIKKDITNAFGDDFISKIGNKDFQDKVKKFIETDIQNRNITDITQRYNLLKNIFDDIFGFGPLQDVLQDTFVTEIMVCRYDKVYIEKQGKLQFAPDIYFLDEQQLLSIIQKIVQPLGREINESSPIVDARLPDGSRVNATVKPISPDGATLTIRKFAHKKLTGEDYLKFDSLDKNELQFLEACVKARINLFVSGGTGSGKTTLLNMLSNYIPPQESIITIEDSCELKLYQDNVRRFEARPKTSEGSGAVTIRDLVKNALRQRPDRIIVGEIRDGVVVDYMRAASSGHDGSMSTGHANSPRQLVDSVFPILFGMSDMSFSESAQKQQICSAIDVIVQIARLRDGSRKITNITEVVGYGRSAALKLGIQKSEIDNGKIYLQDIFRFNENFVNKDGVMCGRHEATGYIPARFLEKMKVNGIDLDTSIFKKTE